MHGCDCKFYTRAGGHADPARLRFHFERTTMTFWCAFGAFLPAGRRSAEQLCHAPDPEGESTMNNHNGTPGMHIGIDCTAQ